MANNESVFIAYGDDYIRNKFKKFRIIADNLVRNTVLLSFKNFTYHGGSIVFVRTFSQTAATSVMCY